MLAPVISTYPVPIRTTDSISTGLTKEQLMSAIAWIWSRWYEDPDIEHKEDFIAAERAAFWQQRGVHHHRQSLYYTNSDPLKIILWQNRGTPNF